jgi:hypothetical protein
MLRQLEERRDYNICNTVNLGKVDLMKIKVLSAVALLASVTALWAADSAGKWFARIPNPGTVLERFVLQTVFTFRVDGTELLGTVSYPFGEETPINRNYSRS